MNYEIEIINEISSDAKDENEFLNIFNEKLATIILHYENLVLGRCKNVINAI